MSNTIEKTVVLDQDEILAFCGQNDSQIKEIEKRTKTQIITRGNELKVRGEEPDVKRTVTLIEELKHISRDSRHKFDEKNLKIMMNSFESEKGGSLKDIYLESIPIALKRKTVAPLTAGQKEYVEAIRNNDIVFGIGPAGTGKTYLACAMAVASLLQNQVRRIILARPAVEAGEKLGFLPGDLQEKINPYLRPLYDALFEMIDVDRANEYIESGVIEVAPLAFMRGRTLNNAFVILDEAQNTSTEQMKMFLTRLGFDSRAVITGDITQIDLDRKGDSGLVQVQKILSGIDGIHFTYFDDHDVVRHELVQKIIRAYEKNHKKLNEENESNT